MPLTMYVLTSNVIGTSYENIISVINHAEAFLLCFNITPLVYSEWLTIGNLYDPSFPNNLVSNFTSPFPTPMPNKSISTQDVNVLYTLFKTFNPDGSIHEFWSHKLMIDRPTMSSGLVNSPIMTELRRLHNSVVF